MNPEIEQLITSAHDALPKELRAGLRDADWIGRLEVISQEHRLSNQQRNSYIIVCMLRLYNIQDFETLKSDLVETVQLSDVEAEELEDAFVERVLIPVINATEDRGMKRYIRDDDSYGSVLFYRHNWIEVTPKLLKHRAQTIPIRNISNVSAFKMPFEGGAMLLNGLILLISLGGVFTFSYGSFIGLGVGALCAFNLKHIFQKHYVVLIEFNDGKELTIDTSQLDFAIDLRDALHKAMSMN